MKSLACCALLMATAQVSSALEPGTPVPPTLEIEVLDPGVDPLGNPAVVLMDTDDPTQQQIDIPPAILVHRYYYTGNRDFQAQLLPGGPCIAVMNHPKTGERCYVPVQMLPGAPRVAYTGRRIEYDFGNRGISIVFGHRDPVVRYRSGDKLVTKVSEALLVEETLGKARHLKAVSSKASDGAMLLLTGSTLFAADAVGQIFSPFKQAAALGPLSGIGDRFEQRVEQHRAKKQLGPARDDEREWVRRFP